MLAAAVESVLQRERDLRERGIEYLLYRLAKTAFVDNYVGLMRQVLNRLQELEAPLLEGSTDAKVYREVARLRRALNPLERSLMHMAEFSATVRPRDTKVERGCTSWPPISATTASGSSRTSRCCATGPRS